MAADKTLRIEILTTASGDGIAKTRAETEKAVTSTKQLATEYDDVGTAATGGSTKMRALSEAMQAQEATITRLQAKRRMYDDMGAAAKALDVQKQINREFDRMQAIENKVNAELERELVLQNKLIAAAQKKALAEAEGGGAGGGGGLATAFGGAARGLAGREAGSLVRHGAGSSAGTYAIGYAVYREAASATKALLDLIDQVNEKLPGNEESMGRIKRFVELCHDPFSKLALWASRLAPEFKLAEQAAENAKKEYTAFADKAEYDSSRLVRSMQEVTAALIEQGKQADANRRVGAAETKAANARAVYAGTMDSATAAQQEKAQKVADDAAGVLDAAKIAQAKFDEADAAVVAAKNYIRELLSYPATPPAEMEAAQKALVDIAADRDKALQILHDAQRTAAVKIAETVSQSEQGKIQDITQIGASVTNSYQEILKAAQDKLAAEGGKVSAGFGAGIESLTQLLKDKIPDAQQTQAFAAAFTMLENSQEGRDMKIIELITRLTAGNTSTLSRIAALEGSVANWENALLNTAAQTGIRLNVR